MGTMAAARASQLADFNSFFSPFLQRSVGFDRLFDSMNRTLHETAGTSNYPPHDIVQVGSNDYRITLAVAGFRPSEIDVQFENGVLTVTGQKGDASDESERRFIRRGIAQRQFTQRFSMAEHIRVEGAELKDGLLHIALHRELPEALKPRTIEVVAA